MPESSERPASRGGSVALALAVAVLAILTFVGTLGAGFVWDDHELIVEDDAIRSVSHLGAVLGGDFFARHGADAGYGYWRPTTTLSYLADFQLWHLSPRGYHLTNVLLHAGCSVLLVLLLGRLGLPLGVVAATALLFAVHPVHSESVAWIAGRTDVLSLFLALVALLLALPRRPVARSQEDARTTRALTPVRSVASMAAFALALLAKEMSVVVIPWLWLIHRIHYGADWRAATRRSLPYLAVAGGYALVRFAALGVAPPPGQGLDGAVAAALTAPSTLLRYLLWLVAPSALDDAYVQNPYVHSVLDPRFLPAVAVLGGLSWAAVVVGRARREVALAAALLAVSFLPVLNLVRVAGPADMGAVMAERFCYWPSVPFCLLAGLGVGMVLDRSRPRSARRAVALLCLGVLLAAGVYGTTRRNALWHDEDTFLAATLRRSPDAALLWARLASREARAGKVREAGAALAHAEELDPESTPTRSARVLLDVTTGRVQDAIAIQERLVQEHGTVRDRDNLAFVYRVAGRLDDAQRELQRLVAADRASFQTHYNLGVLFRLRGDSGAAIQAFEDAFHIRPDNALVANEIVALELGRGNLSAARAAARRGLSFNPDDPDLLNNLAVIALRAGDVAGAAAQWESLLAVHPEYVRARINYAYCLVRTGRTEAAAGQLQRALETATTSELRELARGGLVALQRGEGIPTGRR